MPSYDTRTVAMVVGLSPKELDNLLSRSELLGVTGGSQGVDRRITADAVLRVAIGREVRDMFSCPWARALELAVQLEKAAEVRSESGRLALQIDVSSLKSAIRAQLMDVAEYVVRARRGRPPARQTKSLIRRSVP